MRVWVYYNRATGEATIYGAEPPALFGRRQYDIGPIELDEGLIARYGEAKDAWRAAHAEFMASVRAAEGPLDRLGPLHPVDRAVGSFVDGQEVAGHLPEQLCDLDPQAVGDHRE